MKLLMSVFMIRFIIALFENKAKANKKNLSQQADEQEAKHPAAFQVR
jgi:hypothetical protein